MIFLVALFTLGSAFQNTAFATEPKPSLSARIEKLSPKPENFFYTPKTPLDREFYRTGLLHHWQMYGKTGTPDESKFKGYILFADPFHRGLKRISFLLGTDCSNFVHRIFQMAGANFPFLKTRHWIHLTEALKTNDPEAYFKKQNASETPIDMKLCVWKSVASSFKRIENEKELEVGDIVVYPKSEGILGMKGHMGFISSVKPSPMVLQSKYPQGITALPIEKGEHTFLRYVGELRTTAPNSLHEALEGTYPESVGKPANCVDEDGGGA